MPASPPARPARCSPLAVLDTNVLLDWLVFRDAAAGPLVAAIESGALQPVAWPAMREELVHMLASDRLRRWAPDAAAALRLHDRHVRVLPAATAQPSQAATHPRCTDADDQVFVDLALGVGARWLLTHDRALLRLARRLRPSGVAVLTPAAWAAWAAAQPPDAGNPP